MHRIAAQVASSNKPFSTNLAFAVAALACLLMARPGLASDGAGVVAAPMSARGVVQATTSMPAMARVDFDGFPHHASAATSVRNETLARDHVGGADGHDAAATKPATSSLGSIAEPATIAVLGFTAAALIALRRRKNAEA